jgi:apolipoprotein D and lipocalin family protein
MLPVLDMSDDDLDARIQRAELALIARDQRVKHQVALLGQRVRRAREPARWIVPVASGALVLLAGWWLWRRRRPRPAPAAAMDEHSPRTSGGEAHRSHKLDWLELLALAWPFVPESWRRRWGPTSTGALMNLGLAASRYLMGGLRGAFAGGGEAAHDAEGRELPPLHTVEHVDLGRYAGTWYEIARLPSDLEQGGGGGQPKVHYAVHGGGVIDVLSGWFDASGQEQVVRGEARVLPGSHGAKLAISFLPAWLRWLPFGWTDQWVLHVDETYALAVVGAPDRRHLWVLARRPRIEPETLDAAVDLARAQGFAVDRLLVSQPD